jgi:hypothetical protein
VVSFPVFHSKTFSLTVSSLFHLKESTSSSEAENDDYGKKKYSIATIYLTSNTSLMALPSSMIFIVVLLAVAVVI